MVDLSGLEPKQTESKSVVLPLHHRSKVDAGDSNPVHDQCHVETNDAPLVFFIEHNIVMDSN